MLTNSFTEKCETWVTWELFMGFPVGCCCRYYSTWLEGVRVLIGTVLIPGLVKQAP